jgi:hypothetical protein
MKPWRAMLVLAGMLLGIAVASDALAARGGRSGGHSGGHAGAHSGSHAAGTRGHFSGGGHFAPRFRTGVFIGAPLFAPLPFYSYPVAPYYDYSAPLMAPAAPVYIEQYPGQAEPQPSTDWYYCASTNGYYPYVKECAEGWQRVPPQPPS